MRRENINDLLAFLAVAREQSFTRAALRLGMSQSALSHTVRGLEQRLGLRLLTRTTRSVSTTEAGERLLRTIGPRFDEIGDELTALGELRDKPAGTIRITATDHAVDRYIWPRLAKILPSYPDLKMEVTVDYGLSDIVADRYDIGVRHGDQVAKDMIAVRISPNIAMAIVCSPSYLSRRAAPSTPQDLMAHDCITLRLATKGSLYPWELKSGEKELQARVDGHATFNGVYQMINGALSGAGLAFVPVELVQQHLESGLLVSVMKEWCPVFPGFHLYYPNRRQSSRALSVVVEALRAETGE